MKKEEWNREKKERNSGRPLSSVIFALLQFIAKLLSKDDGRSFLGPQSDYVVFRGGGHVCFLTPLGRLQKTNTFGHFGHPAHPATLQSGSISGPLLAPFRDPLWLHFGCPFGSIPFFQVQVSDIEITPRCFWLYQWHPRAPSQDPSRATADAEK